MWLKVKSKVKRLVLLSKDEWILDVIENWQLPHKLLCIENIMYLNFMLPNIFYKHAITYNVDTLLIYDGVWFFSISHWMRIFLVDIFIVYLIYLILCTYNVKHYFSSLHMFNVICLKRIRMYNKLYAKFNCYKINKIFWYLKKNLFIKHYSNNRSVEMHYLFDNHIYIFFILRWHKNKNMHLLILSGN